MKAPLLIPNVSANVHAHRAKKELLEPLGLPPALPGNWREKALDKFGELLRQRRSLKLYLDICVRCGACSRVDSSLQCAAGPTRMSPGAHRCAFDLRARRAVSGWRRGLRRFDYALLSDQSANGE